MSMWHSYGWSDAPVVPAVAAHPLPGVVAVRALRVLFMAFLCSSWPFPAQNFDGKLCWKKCLFFKNTSRLLKKVPAFLKFRACLLHNVPVNGVKSNFCKPPDN